MYSIGVAADLLGVCCKKLRRWDKENKIKCVRTQEGHRRFPIQEIQRLLEEEENGLSESELNPIKNRTCAIYGRVSSHKQNKRGI